MSKIVIFLGVFIFCQLSFAEDIYTSLNQSLQRFEGKTGQLSTNLAPDLVGEYPKTCSIQKLFSKDGDYNSYLGTSIELANKGQGFWDAQFFSAAFIVESSSHISEKEVSGSSDIFYNTANKPDSRVNFPTCGSNGLPRPFNGNKRPQDRTNRLIVTATSVEILTEYYCGLILPKKETISWVCKF